MTLSTARVRKYLKDFDFEPLFIEELGWDRHAANLELTINGQQYPLRGFAEKRGVQVFECRAETPAAMPDFKTQRKIETQLRRAAREHLVIYTDATKTKQVWRPVDWRGHEFYPGHQSGDSLIEKLQAIQIPLDEEEALDLLGAVHKLRDAFDRDRITKRFYDYFQKEHKAFLEFIEGILDQGEREWYASLMLNRLMFVYFIQKKGFLDRDTDYLRNRLKTVQSHKGKGKFQTFYRYFLLMLFRQGFSTQPEQRELDSDLKNLLGDVPYLNGGLFDVHELEQHNPKIDIPDEAFERIFDFFDQYEWTLDTRPLRNDREINPDVLGYIFEKYINQKQMGAYYTKEDITGYIGRNAIIPYLFDEARKKCAVAFQPGSTVWRLLQDSPDRYIYAAVRKGVIDDRGEIIPIPAEIEKGIENVAERDGWNRPAGAEYSLPTETWREYVARRQRCLEVRQRLTNGGISQINDLITYNLDIRRFAEDAILSSEGPELLRAFYQAITGIAALDPTCGSGAFLFAALNILEPLYEACLDRMQTFLADLERSGNRTSPDKFKDFRAVLKDVAGHPNSTYFILKSIIVRNLYGVDIMEEAVEICKLRLFLKLVSHVDNANHPKLGTGSHATDSRRPRSSQGEPAGALRRHLALYRPQRPGGAGRRCSV
ncbi:MAG: DNA methyltransferase [Pirellulales bacterium]